MSFGDDCVINGFLQFHTFENMTLKVKRTHIRDGCAVALLLHAILSLSAFASITLKSLLIGT